MLGASDRMKQRYYDVRAEKGGYITGDLLWLYNPRRHGGYSSKLQKPWNGPNEIVALINDLIHRIRKPSNGKPQIVYINQLAPYKGDNGPVQPQEVRKCVLQE